MRLSTKAMSLVSALLWGIGVFMICLIHMAIPHYGTGFLDGVSSVYPGFHGGVSFTDTLLGTAYALIDGAFGGFALAWLYNRALLRTTRVG